MALSRKQISQAATLLQCAEEMHRELEKQYRTACQRMQHQTPNSRDKSLERKVKKLRRLVMKARGILK